MVPPESGAKKALHIIRRIFNKRIIPFLLLILLFNVCFLPAVTRVNWMVKSYARSVVQDMTNETNADIRSELTRELEKLQLTADILSGCPSLDGPQSRMVLEALARGENFSEAGILLPSNQLITVKDGVLTSSDGPESFSEEAAHTPCFSSPRKCLENAFYIYQTAPVIQNGSTTGILCGVLDLETLKARYAPAANKHVGLFLVDSATGDFLVDTLHDGELGNLYEDDAPPIIILPDSDSFDALDDMHRSRAGYLEYELDGTDKSYSLYYAPVGIESWMLLLTIPHEEVFQTALFIRNTMYGLIVMELVLFLGYLGIVVVRNYIQSTQQEERFAQMAGQMGIQQTLFHAHQNPSCINSALKKVAEILTAQRTFLISQICGQEIYSWSEQDTGEWMDFDLDVMCRELPETSETFLKGKVLLLDTRQRHFRPKGGERKAFSRQKIVSLMMVPILDSKQDMIGILGALNMRQKWSETSLLEGIAHNFMMALENIRSYRIIEQMSVIDALTGLHNRNSYQRTLVEQENEILGCIYLDANGLHELNNQFGHAAGDAMLKAVADAMRSFFGPEDTYRIGGDEFVVLCRSVGKEEAAERLARMRDQIEGQGYHASAGMAWREGKQAVSAVVTEAEQRMYADKQLYYERLGEPSRQMR